MNNNACSVCGSALEWKEITVRATGQRKSFWSCPNWSLHRDRKNTNFPKKPADVKQPLKAVKLSGQQQFLCDATVRAATRRNTTLAICGIARAGAGKTTTAMATIAAIPGTPKIGYCAFGKKNALEAQARIPKGTAATVHSLLGIPAIRGAYPHSQISRDKPYDIARYFLPDVLDHVDRGKYAPDARGDLRPGERDHLRNGLAKLMNLCMGYLCDGTDRAQVDAILAEHPSAVELTDGLSQLYELLPRAIKLSLDLLPKSMSFSDMISAPCMLPQVAACVPRFDVLVADEAQDLDHAQHHLLLLALGYTSNMLTQRFNIPRKPAAGYPGLLLYIGDDHQAIFAFRGADHQSLASLRVLLYEAADYYRIAAESAVVDAPLTQTRRCPKTHVKLMQHIVADFESLPEAPDGSVEIADPEHLAYYFKHPNLVGSDHMIVCRCAAPLIKAAYMLIREGITVRVEGRDIAGGITSQIRRLTYKIKERCSDNHKPSLAELLEEVERWRSESKTSDQKSPAAIQRAVEINDKCDTIIAASEHASTIEQLVFEINRLFGIAGENKQNAVVLSTVHKAKGLEAKNIYIIEPTLMPHPRAVGDEAALLQEMNLLYVAGTRSLDRLVFVGGLPAPLSGTDVPISVFTPPPDAVALTPRPFAHVPAPAPVASPPAAPSPAKKAVTPQAAKAAPKTATKSRRNDDLGDLADIFNV